MTANTMSSRQAGTADLVFAHIEARAARAVQALVAWWTEPRQREPRTAEELIEWAGQFEATQPGFAADLRAAARRHLASDADAR